MQVNLGALSTSTCKHIKYVLDVHLYKYVCTLYNTYITRKLDEMSPWIVIDFTTYVTDNTYCRLELLTACHCVLIVLKW